MGTFRKLPDSLKKKAQAFLNYGADAEQQAPTNIFKQTNKGSAYKPKKAPKRK